MRETGAHKGRPYYERSACGVGEGMLFLHPFTSFADNVFRFSLGFVVGCQNTVIFYHDHATAHFFQRINALFHRPRISFCPRAGKTLEPLLAAFNFLVGVFFKHDS